MPQTFSDRAGATVEAPPREGSPAANASAARILERLIHEVGSERCGPLIGQRAILRCGGPGVVVTVPTGFVAGLLDRRLGAELRRAACDELGEADGSALVRFVVDPDAFRDGAHVPPAVVAPSAPPASPSRRRQGSAGPALRHRLDDFVVGECNRLAFSAAERLADPADRSHLSPLFIHGPSGVGKTHLLQGIAVRFRERSPRASVRYLSAEAFMNDYVLAVRGSRVDAFRSAYRGVDLLCIDDVHFLSSKQGTQTELLHTFDALDLGGARIVLASDEHPRRIDRIADGLSSRFVAGMVVTLGPPTPDVLERIVLGMASRRGLTMDVQAARQLAALCPPWSEAGASVRELEGMVTRVEAVHRLLSDGPCPPVISVADVRRAPEVSARRPSPPSRRPIRPEAVVREVCAAMGITADEVLGKERHRRAVLARAMVCHLCRRLTTLSYPEIARAIARRNHSSVIAACRRLERLVERGAPVAAGCELDGLPLGAAVERLSAAVLRAAPRG